MHSLPLFHRIAGEKVVVVGEGDMAAAKRRLVERAGGMCVGEADGGDARIAFVALEEGADAVATRLKTRGLLVNVADRPELCDFTLPSVLERGDVLVAVSTGGASAGLAKQLRLRLEGFLPASLGALARALAENRERMRTRWPDPAQRRRALDAALAQGAAIDLIAPGSAAKVDDWLDHADAEGAPAALVTIALRSRDPDDLTLREARMLGTADTILHDPAVGAAILDRARADAARFEVGDRPLPERTGLTVVLELPRAESGSGPDDAWFHYTRTAGRITAVPVNVAGWLTFIGMLAAAVIIGFVTMRWAMRIHPVAAFIALPLVIGVTIAAILAVAIRKGRRV